MEWNIRVSFLERKSPKRNREGYLGVLVSFFFKKKRAVGGWIISPTRT